MNDTTTRLCSVGKGILASDESTTTIGKRFEKVGLTNDEVGTLQLVCLSDVEI